MLRAASNHTTLAGVRRANRADNGEAGKGKLMHGKRGSDAKILVPVGASSRCWSHPDGE